MEYHEQIINRHGCVCRLSEEIVMLHSIIDSLKWANALKDELIADAAATIADLRRQLGRV